MENDKDVITLIAGISLHVHSFQARVSDQIFVYREFRPIKLEYYSCVPNCTHALPDGSWEYKRRVK